MNSFKIFLCTVFAIIFSTAVYADAPISVTVDGERVNFADQQPVVIDGRTLVPVRGVFEALGFEVDWNSHLALVTISRAGTVIIIEPDSDIFAANGVRHVLEVQAQIINGRTMLPLRAILESVNYEVAWDANSRTVLVSTESSGAGAAVATINGLKIGINDINFRLQEAAQMMGETDFQSREVHEETIRIAALNVLLLQYAKENGIELTANEIASNRSTIFYNVETHGEEEFIELLRADGIQSLAHLEYIFGVFGLSEKVVLEIIADEEKFADFEQYMEELLGAKHILISFMEHGSEENALQFAEEIWQRLIDGEDFDELMETYSDDLGKESFPQGYTFLSGEMVPEFEQGTLSLEIGEMSEPVVSQFGFHIILRTEPDPTDFTVLNTRDDRMKAAVIKGFETKIETAEIIFLS